MFSLKLIEKKVQKGRKLTCNDISPHPVKKLRVDHNCTLEETPPNKPPRSKRKRISRKNKADVPHPIIKMKVRSTSDLSSNHNQPSRWDELDSEILCDDNSNDRYFSIAKKKNKHTFNKEEKEGKKLESNKRTLPNSESYKRINADNNMNEVNGFMDDCETKSNSLDETYSISNSKSEDGCNNVEEIENVQPVVLKRKKYSNNKKKQRNPKINSGNSTELNADSNWNATEDNLSDDLNTTEYNSNLDDSTMCQISDYFPNFTQAGRFLSILMKNKHSVIVILEPNVNFYLQGACDVNLLIGMASVYGYKLQKKKPVTLYSPTLFSFMSIDSGKGKDLSADHFSFLSQYQVIAGNPNFKEFKNAVCIEISRSATRLPKYLSLLGYSVFKLGNQRIWPQTIGCIPILPGSQNEKDGTLIELGLNWSHSLEPLLKEKDPNVMLCGGKGVGKSTLFKYLINRTLCNDNYPDGILCLDLDPGQPEFSLPGTISLVHVKEPLLGQAFTHNDTSCRAIILQQILIGSVSVQNVLVEYFNAIQILLKTYQDLSFSAPTFFNTMGWTRDIGIDIITDIIRMIKPTHVIEFDSKRKIKNFSQSLDCDSINSSQNGLSNDLQNYQLNYKHIILSEQERINNNKSSSLASELRNLRTLSYFNKLWPSETENFDLISCPVKRIPFSKLCIHSMTKFVPHSHLLLAINASLVALTCVNESNTVEVSDGLFKVFAPNISLKQPPECFGWGIVKGIDMKLREIHLLTPLEDNILEQKVNSLMICSLTLPEEMFNFLSTDNGPYNQNGERTGAAKLQTPKRSKSFKKR